jgi:hypothetical protein
MQAMAGQGGDTVNQQVARDILALFWDRGRACWGDEVELGIIATGFKDGASVKFSVYEKDQKHDGAVKDIDGTIDKGRAKAKYKLDFKNEDPDAGDVYEYYYIAEVDGTVKSQKKDCPILYCDLDPPSFSE